MKFMLLMIPNVYRNNKQMDTFVPPADMVEKMNRYNNELLKARLLESMDEVNGLHPLTKGARVVFNGGKSTVTDGPMIETKEVLGGYWFITAKSKEEVVKWVERCPAQDGDIIEIRPIFEPADFEK